jgi:anaerobic selenocysteine-containing dehydrogenase
MAPHSSLTEHLAGVLNTVLGRVNREGERIESGWFLAPDLPRRAQVVPPRPPATGPPSRVRGLRGYNGEMPTAALAEEILTPGEGRVRALVVSGGNPVVAWPDQELTLQALRDLELLVVLDHRMSATAELAHYVVPPRLSLERADVPHLMDMWFAAPYTNYTPAVVTAEGDVFAEWEVFWHLAARLGTPLRLGGREVPMDRLPTDDEMLDLAYARARLPMEEIRRQRGVVHEDRALVVQPAEPDAAGRFAVAPADLMVELSTVAGEETSAAVIPTFRPDAYPFRLVSRRLKAVLNSLGPELPVLRARGTTNHAHMHPDDLADLGLAEGDLVEITSPRASLVGVVAAAPDVRRGVVSMAHAWGGTSVTDEKVRDVGAPTNRLVSTSAGHDPVTGMPVQSAIPVRVAPAGER